MSPPRPPPAAPAAFPRVPPAAGTGLWCVVLAAGGSRRLGTPKQLLRHGSRPLLLRAVDAATATSPGRVVVVLGAQAARIRAPLRPLRRTVVTVRNPRWRTGLASSLRAGLGALPERAGAVLVLLADQPEVDAAALARLVKAWRTRPGEPAAARYQGRIGVPAILPRRHWRELRGLQGDTGARALLRGLGEVTAVDMPEAAFDVDTPRDVERLQAPSAARRWFRRRSSRWPAR